MNSSSRMVPASTSARGRHVSKMVGRLIKWPGILKCMLRREFRQHEPV
jgi:hypothetical protein